MQNISLQSSGMLRKQNFEIVLGLKVTQQSWLLLCAFSPPLFFRFSCVIFFSLAGHLVGFVLVGRVFRKAFRISGLGERKSRCSMEQDFHGDFQVNVTWFFASFSGVLDWIVLILVWFERSLHSAQVSGQSCPWPLKLMMSQRVEMTWICTGGYRRFRGEWVKGRCSGGGDESIGKQTLIRSLTTRGWGPLQRFQPKASLLCHNSLIMWLGIT